MASLEHFFDRVAAVNPFTENRVSGLSPRECDVEQVHARQFDELIALARVTRDQQCALGALLWGEAGVGKSHVLSRLARWAAEEKHAIFIYVQNPSASAENLPRSLLKSVISILTGGRVDELASTLLYRLTNAFMREAVENDTSRAYSRASAEVAYRRLVDRLAGDDLSQAVLVDRGVYEVLLRFFTSACLARAGADDEHQARLALRWLSGDFLDTEEARLLGLQPARAANEPVGLSDNQHVKQVLVALTRMALSRQQPFLLCFDQVDNLDTDQASALARFLEALLDSSRNMLVVLAGIQATLLQWRKSKVIQDSAWDRLGQFEVTLQKVTIAEARTLVAARIKRFLAAFADLEGVGRRLEQDPLFPLGEKWSEEFFKGKSEVRPRDAITWAREGWRREQEVLRTIGGVAWLAEWGRRCLSDGRPLPLSEEQVRAVIDAKVAETIVQQRSSKQAQPHTLPPDKDNLAGLVYALLEQSKRLTVPAQLHVTPRAASSRSGAANPYDLDVRRRRSAGIGPRRTGLAFVSTDNATSATATLRKLVQDPDRPDRVLLVTDERQPLPLATKGKEYYQELCERGADQFQHVRLALSEYAELDALRAAIGLARSGDLEIELPGGGSRAVTERDVIASHSWQEHYHNAAVLRTLVPRTDPDPARGNAQQLESSSVSA
jgi:type II secretory pathway predicted ATPase ExeA